MIPVGPEDKVDIDKTIYQTMKNCGEIEIVFSRSLKDRLKVILAIDNGGWSMDPYIPVVQTLFDYARDQFKDLKTCFFHNDSQHHLRSLYSDITKSVALSLCKEISLFPIFDRLDRSIDFEALLQFFNPSIILRHVSHRFPMPWYHHPQTPHL